MALQVNERVAWQAGETTLTFYGGWNRASDTRSTVTISSIIAVKGHGRQRGEANATPPLSNRELFHRDGYVCLYCGGKFLGSMLTRDHLQPLSRGGRDVWSNVVTACTACNLAKGARTPEEANMKLLAVPYAPNRAEYLVLSNRRILADQMEFLEKRFSARWRPT